MSYSQNRLRRRGRDRLHGGQGEDTINGDKGHDFMSGGKDDDTQNGGGGADLIFANRGGGGDRDRVLADQYDEVTDATPADPTGSCETVVRADASTESDTEENETEEPEEDENEGS